MEKHNDIIMHVEDLAVEFDTYGGTVKAVRGVDFTVQKGKTLAIVGESGCGKSVTVQSMLQLIPMPPGRITRGSAKFEGRELIGLSPKQINNFRGKKIGMIFQDPMSSLNPTMRIGQQIAETICVHLKISKKEAMRRAVSLLSKTKMPEPEKRSLQYPFEFSGGMLQRAMIAMSLACNPSILIADEPTTALDVTIQAQIIELMNELQRSENMSIVLITHDLGVVARMADAVAVMYAGQVVEKGCVDDIFYKSAHPYTIGLREAMPTNEKDANRKLNPIEGSPPDLFKPPTGCGYSLRCPYVMDICIRRNPEPFKVGDDHISRCWLQCPQAPRLNNGIYQAA